MINIIKNEWKMLVRNRTFVYLNIFFISVMSIVIWFGVIQNTKQETYRQNAQKFIRNQWDNLNAMNPHGAAHYGTYAFKPNNILNSMDSGINSITGNVIKLEGHVQNEIAYSEVSQSLSISKFGKLKSSLLLQYIIPLILIFLAYNTVISEKENQRLKLILIQGISMKQVIFGKILSIWIYSLILLFVTVIFQIFFSKIDYEVLSRLFLLILSYGFYFYIIISLSIYFSSTLKSNSSALSLILVIWIMWTIFFPKIWGNTVEKIYQLPTRAEFKTMMKEDRSRGIDGHNPRDKRRESLKNKYLSDFKVDSLKNLPINFDGIVMQEDEEYGNIVWDKHFGKKYETLKSQKILYQISGLINPFASLQSLSMALCGTDMFHHLDFLEKSENYRRYFIKTLNDKHAYGGSKTGEWDWKVDSTFFQTVENFNYIYPKISNQILNYRLDVLFLLFWVIFVSTLLSFKIDKNIIT